jgi:hypothetical protein
VQASNLTVRIAKASSCSFDGYSIGRNTKVCFMAYRNKKLFVICSLHHYWTRVKRLQYLASFVLTSFFFVLFELISLRRLLETNKIWDNCLRHSISQVMHLLWTWQQGTFNLLLRWVLPSIVFLSLSTNCSIIVVVVSSVISSCCWILYDHTSIWFTT